MNYLKLNWLAHADENSKIKIPLNFTLKRQFTSDWSFIRADSYRCPSATNFCILISKCEASRRCSFVSVRTNQTFAWKWLQLEWFQITNFLEILGAFHFLEQTLSSDLCTEYVNSTSERFAIKTVECLQETIFSFFCIQFSSLVPMTQSRAMVNLLSDNTN